MEASFPNEIRVREVHSPPDKAYTFGDVARVPALPSPPSSGTIVASHLLLWRCCFFFCCMFLQQKKPRPHFFFFFLQTCRWTDLSNKFLSWTGWKDDKPSGTNTSIEHGRLEFRAGSSIPRRWINES